MNVLVLVDSLNKIGWKTNNGDMKKFSIKQVWEDYRDNGPIVHWNKLVWFSQNIPSHMFVLWMAIQGRLQTHDTMFVWNKDATMRCSLCKSCMDSRSHLFFQCTYAARILSALKRKIPAYGIPVEWNDLIDSMVTQFQNNSIKSVKDCVGSWCIFHLTREE